MCDEDVFVRFPLPVVLLTVCSVWRCAGCQPGFVLLLLWLFEGLV